MKLQAVAGEEEVDEALRLFQVSTLDAALSGSLSGACLCHVCALMAYFTTFIVLFLNVEMVLVCRSGGFHNSRRPGNDFTR